MLVAVDRDLNEIISYLKTGFQDCIFMYIDIKKYRLTNPAMKVWFDRRSNGSIGTVVMKYHTGISVYSDSNVIPLDDISGIIQKYAPKSITGRKEIIEQIYSIHNDLYTVLYGAVFKNNAIIDIEGDELVEPAKDEDMLEIAKLICSDEEIGSYYDSENLAVQLLERKHTGMGRNYIIRKEGKIVELETGKVLGTHKGYWFHTIGQRKGLFLSGGPWFVVRKDIEENVLYVSQGYDPDAAHGHKVTLMGFHYLSSDIWGDFVEQEIKFKIRHTPEFHPGVLRRLPNGLVEIESDDRIQGIAAGQYATIYDNEAHLVVASGMII